MQPVVPNVKVGDVLIGTRHLRNFLEQLALHLYLSKHSNSLPKLEKGQKFVVLCNNLDNFIVGDFESNIILPFSSVNPLDRFVFSKWFSRKPEKVLDLNKWPTWAQNIRLMFHLAANLHPKLSPFIAVDNNYFGSHKYFSQLSAKDYHEMHKMAAVCGLTRSKQAPYRGIGHRAIRLEDLIIYRERNSEMLRERDQKGRKSSKVGPVKVKRREVNQILSQLKGE